jgi:hypothetical protein
VKKGADYVFSLNWDMLDFNKPAAAAPYITLRTASMYEEKHGRKETRDYAVSDDVEWPVKQFPQWKSVKSIGAAESTRDAGEGMKTGGRFLFPWDKYPAPRGGDFYFQPRHGRGIVCPRGPVALGNRKPAALYA